MHRYAPKSPLNFHGLDALETLDGWDPGVGMKVRFSPKAHLGLTRIDGWSKLPHSS